MSERPRSIAGVNRLPPEARRVRYAALIPRGLARQFGIDPETWQDAQGRTLLNILAPEGAPSTEIDLRPWAGAEDPLLYLHLADTLNNQLAVLLFVVNDPHSPRFDVDRLPDGTKTHFGTEARNLPAEVQAMKAGLAPARFGAACACWARL